MRVYPSSNGRPRYRAGGVADPATAAAAAVKPVFKDEYKESGEARSRDGASWGKRLMLQCRDNGRFETMKYLRETKAPKAKAREVGRKGRLSGPAPEAGAEVHTVRASSGRHTGRGGCHCRRDVGGNKADAEKHRKQNILLACCRS